MKSPWRQGRGRYLRTEYQRHVNMPFLTHRATHSSVTTKAISDEPPDCKNIPFDKKEGIWPLQDIVPFAIRAVQSRQPAAGEGPCLASVFANEISGSFSFNGLQESTLLKGCA